MVNIVFGDSIAGSVKMADYYAKKNGNIVADLSENLICFHQNLQYGDISDHGIGEIRKKEYKKLHENYLYGYKLKWRELDINPKKSLKRLRTLLEKGETVRFWFSNEAHEFCGFCNILFLIDDMNISNDKILYIKLPDEDIDEKGKLCVYRSSGAFAPKELLKYVPQQQMMTDDVKEYHINQWKQAVEANSELRIVVDNEIKSVSEDYYDEIILDEAKKLDEVFNEATLVGNSLQRIIIFDAFIGIRIEHMISEGIFEVVHPPEKNDAFYKQVLKKSNILSK